MLFFHKKKTEIKTYDKEEWTPVLKSSICTGETVAGFRNNHTGKFRDEALIRQEKDLVEFKERYGIDFPLEKIY
ncbi:MAG: aspartate dehydrogenase [Eubacteriales bacterium]|nr:aspartate dehydrogenase [Eubacteriales bacterium]